MEISLYFTGTGDISIAIYGSMSKIVYLAIHNPDELPPPPQDYLDSPFARVLLHAFSTQEQEKWKV